MRHLLKHMFAVTVIILIIFCTLLVNYGSYDGGKRILSSAMAMEKLLSEQQREKQQQKASPTATIHSVFASEQVEKSLVQLDRTLTEMVNNSSGSTSTNTSHSHRNIRSINKNDSISIGRSQSRFISSLQPVVNILRFLVKRVYVTYHWYSPELQLGKCMINYAHTQYPEMMQRLKMENMAKIVQSIYSACVEYINNVVNGDSQYDDDIVDKSRISAKIEQMTKQLHSYDDNNGNDKRQNSYYVQEREQQKQQISQQKRKLYVPTMAPNHNYNFNYINYINSLASIQQNKPTANNADDDANNNKNAEIADRMDSGSSDLIEISDTVNERQKLNYSHLWPYYENHRSEWRPRQRENSARSVDTNLKSDTVMFIGPRQLMSESEANTSEEEFDDDSVMNENIDFNNDSSEETSEDLLDFESMILEGLGFKPGSIKHGSPFYCAKTYVVGVLKRIAQDFVLAVN